MSLAMKYLESYSDRKRIHICFCQCLNALATYISGNEVPDHELDAILDPEVIAEAEYRRQCHVDAKFLMDDAFFARWINSVCELLGYGKRAGINDDLQLRVSTLLDWLRCGAAPGDDAGLVTLKATHAKLLEATCCVYKELRSDGIRALGLWGYFFFVKLDCDLSDWRLDVLRPRVIDVESSHWPLFMSQLQRDILDALQDGPLTKQALLNAIGLEANPRRLYKKPGGIPELRELGLVDSRPDKGGYFLCGMYATRDRNLGGYVRPVAMCRFPD